MKYLKLKFLLMFFALAMAIPPAWAAEVTDVLNRAFTGVTGTSYTSWSGKTGTSGAVYAGNSAAGNDAIQLRAKSGSAIITTASAGKVKSISVTWNSNTSSGRILDIYCSNSAYTLTNFANGTTGTKVGSIEYGTSTSLAINTDYNYIAIKSNDGALFLDQIEIVWETGGSSLTPITTFSFPQDSYTVTMGESFTAPTLSVDPAGAASEVVYSSSNTNVATVDASTGAVSIEGLGTTTITAAISNSATYQNKSASYLLTVQAPPVKYKLVSDVSKLAAGDKIIFANSDEPGEAQAMGARASSNFRGTAVTVANDRTITTSAAQVLTLEKDDDGWYFKNNEDLYLYASSSSNNNLSATQNKTSDTDASISIDDNVATVVFNGQYTHNNLRYNPNNGNPIFSCYLPSSAMPPVYIYRDATNDPVVSEIIIDSPELPFNDEGGVYTVNGFNLPTDGLGVNVSAGFERNLLNGNNEHYFFPITGGTVTDGQTKVTYTGRDLSATGTITYASGNATNSADISYKSDIYIVTDNGNNKVNGNQSDEWDFTGVKMTENDGHYTGSITTDKANTFILFTRLGNLPTDKRWGTRYVFGPNSSGDWTMPNQDTETWQIDLNADHPIKFPYAGYYEIEIDATVSPVAFTITRTLPQVVKPKITPNGGNFAASQTVTISSTTEDAAIYYTTDGETEPSAENGTLYEGEIALTSTTTLKAIAVKDGMRPSEVATATFTKTGIETLAGENGVNSLASGKNFTFVGEVVVTANKSYKTNNGNTNTVVFIRDLNQNNASGTGGSVFYNTAADLEVKTKLAPGWTGKTTIYNGWTEITNAGNITTNGTVDEVVPFDRSGQTLTQANQSEYIILRNITINGDKATWTDGSKTTVEYDLYDRFGVGYEDGEYEYLEGVVNVFINSNNNKIQVYPLDFKEVVKPLAVTLPEAPEEHYKVGQVVKVKATVENGSENTVLTYKVGNETLAIGEDGNVTLPNKKAGNVVLTVTAVDGDKEATDTKTYVFDPAEALTITLDPATGTYTVGDVKNVTVTVEGAIDANPTITYKFGEEGEAQTYDAATGIVLPTNEAGTINLTVMVDDGGYEHTGATTATATYTVNHKALTITLDPATAEFTVGAKAKVKVTVENAVGDYVVSGMIGEKNYDVDENGYITLPNDKAVEEMILTVTAIDDRENAVVATATGTYKFNAAPAITFDLEIVPEAENNAYAVGDEVKVKATNIKNTIGDYEVTYMVGQNKLTPDNDGYVTFTSAVADEVNLTVSVDDLFEHEREATQTVKFTFDKKAATVEYSAETGTATFGVEPENLPTLTVTPTGLPVIYESTNTAVATVNENGEVSIKGAGKTTISAAFKGNDMYEPASDSYELTVAQGAAGLSYPEGTSVTATVGDNNVVKPTLNNPNELPVTWSSDNESVATVDAEGNVTIVGPGTAHITATYTAGEDSNYATGSATYTITVNDVVVALAAPTFAPAAGTYTEPKEVAIACATPGVTITYAIDGVDKGEYNGPFTISDGEHTVTATAKMGTRTVYTPATNSATYTINAAPAAAIADDYYTLQSNAAEVSGKYANVAGRRTLNFVADADKQAGTVFRIETGEGGAVKTLRSQAVDLQGYANRAMAYVPKVIDLVLSTLANSSLGDPETPGTGILGENGLDLILNKFYEGFDYNLYVEEGTEGTYRIYGRTPSMQHVVDFYHENTAQVEEKLPMLEGYINQVLDKIRNKVGQAGMNEGAIPEFSLKTVRDSIAKKNGIALIDPVDNDSKMEFYRQVLNNKEYVWDFAYQTAMIYVDAIKQTGTYQNLPNEYKLYVEKMEKVRPDTKYYIIERGNELDYISENNGEIISNDPRTLWTLTKRENFTVNVPEDNKLNDSYYTTLYTDFGYKLPADVKAYAVTGIDENDVAQLTEITDGIPAQTPVLLKAEAAGDKVLTLKKESRGGAIEGNLLEGPDYLIKTYGITSPTVEMLFNMAAGFVPAETLADYEYLKLRTSGTVNNKYFWNVNDALDKCTYKDANNENDCVVRSLVVKDGTLAFSEHWTTETNKAFLVSDTKPVIYLEKETLAAPTFSPVPGSYTVDNGQNVTITITTEDDATIKYSTDGGKTWNTYEGPIAASDDMTIVAKAEKDGMIASDEVTAVYVIDNPAELPDVPVMKGYFQIMNNGNEKYAHVQGRKTLTFTNAPADKAGTVIWLETNNKGQVQSLRSQAADLQRYADRAMSYVPEIVELVADKLNADGEGNILGENGLDAIMAKFNKSFDHHLYVEEAQGGYRIYGKTPSMQPVVDFYREHTAQVEAKLPMLESFINSALNKLKEKLGGQSVFTPFSLHQIWENMGGNLPEPVVGNDAAIMDFYRAVLNNKNYVWDFAYQTAMIYLNNIKGTQTYQNLVNEHPEISQYIDKIDQVRPDFKYYIVADGDKPDFISEGNVDINNNAARTIWTLEERKTFKLNSASELFGCPLATNGVGGYFTTNYTDFAYTLPEGVTAYKVTGVNDEGEATLEALSGTIPAQTPVLLVAKEDKPYELTLTTDAGTAVTGNLLVGPDYLINEYDLKTAQVQGIFDMIKQKLGQDFYNNYVAQYEHLADLNSGTVNNKYFWNVNSYLDYCTYKNANNEDECVVRSLATNENGELAFSEHWKTETNKAFLVSDTFDVITLPSLERGDVNHDGYVNLLDVTDLIDRLLVSPDAEHLKACPYCSDVDGNGSVSIKDVTVLIDILLENPAPDPEEGDGN